MKVNVYENDGYQSSFTEISPIEFSAAQINIAEFSIVEIDALQVSPIEIDVWKWMPEFPLIPYLHSLFEKIKMVLVCHLLYLRQELPNLSFVSLYIVDIDRP